MGKPRRGRPPRRQRKLKGGPPRKPSAYNKFIARMTKGGKMTLKQAAKKWKGRGRKPTRRSPSVRRTTRRTTKTKGGRKTVGRRGGFNSQKMMKLIRLVALGAPVVSGVAQYGMTKAAAVDALRQYTGVNAMTGQFDWADLARGWTPYLGSVAVTYGIPKLAGLIRGI